MTLLACLILIPCSYFLAVASGSSPVFLPILATFAWLLPCSILAAAIVALVPAGIYAAAKKSFRSPLLVSYGVLIIPIAILGANILVQRAGAHQMSGRSCRSRRCERNGSRPARWFKG